MSLSYYLEFIGVGDINRRRLERLAVDRLMIRVFGHQVQVKHTLLGAPFILGYHGHISISHSRRYAALAVSDDDVIGIDIEEPRPDQLEKVASRFLSQEEYDYYSRLPHGILKAWTLKEASYKTLQSGPVDLCCYQLPLSPDDSIIKVDTDSGSVSLEIMVSEFLASKKLYLSIVRLG